MLSSVGSGFTNNYLGQVSQKLFDLFDANADGSVQTDDLENLLGKSSSVIDRFISSADTDSDVAVTEQEFASVISRLFQEIRNEGTAERKGGQAPPPPLPPDSAALMSFLDTDGDGALSVDEMTAGGVADAETIFTQIDADGDGLASSDELDAFAKTMAVNEAHGSHPPPPPPDSAEMVSSLDANGDGVLTLDEMTAGGVPDAKTVFNEIDTDGDGQITRAESDAFYETRELQHSDSQIASSENKTGTSGAAQNAFIGLLMEMIAQNNSYSVSNGSGASLYA